MAQADSKRWRRVLVCLVLAACGSAAAADSNGAAPRVRAVLTLGRDRLFVDEVFQLTLTLETRDVRLGSELRLEGLPGADRMETGPFEEWPLERQIDGRTIYETRVYRARCRVLRPGRLRLAPTLRTVQVVRERIPFGSRWQQTPLALQPKPVEVEVLPIPPYDGPGTASGAVGDFAMQVTCEPREVAVEDLVRITIAVKGTGYLAAAQSPRIRGDETFRIYEPRRLEQDDNTLTARQIVIPLSEAASAVPEVSFTFFDPYRAAYRTLTEGPFPLTFRARETALPAPVYKPLDSASGKPQATQTGRQLPDARPSPRWPRLVLGAGLLSALAWALAARPWRKTALLAALACAAGLAFIALPTTRFWDHPAPDSAVMLRTETARLAPAPNALATFKCQAGSLVTVLESHDRWRLIRRGDDEGWVPEDGLELLRNANG